MPDKQTIRRAREDAREGKAPSTQAGEFVREEMRLVGKGKRAPRSRKQAIAIGLSEARRAGVKLPPPRPGRTSEKTRRSAQLAYEEGQGLRRSRKGPGRKRPWGASHQARLRHARSRSAPQRAR